MTGILLLDKSPGISSQQAVRRVQRILGAQRAGHGGTLDPQAEGLLPILLGSATRLSRFLLDGDKGYTAEALLGRVTDTQDDTGKTLAQFPVDVTYEQLSDVTARFVGDIEQLPPMYSALSIGGQRLYKLARKGMEVERSPRPITVHAIDIIHYEAARVLFSVQCSKGTYIRTLIHDIGQMLGCGACMTKLRRTRVGDFSVEDAYTVDALEDAVANGRTTEAIKPPESLFGALPVVSPPAFYAKLLRDGQSVLQHKLNSAIPASGMARLYCEGAFFGFLCESLDQDGSTLRLIWRV